MNWDLFSIVSINTFSFFTFFIVPISPIKKGIILSFKIIKYIYSGKVNICDVLGGKPVHLKTPYEIPLN